MKTFPFVKTNWLFALLFCFAMLPRIIWAECPNDNTALNTNPFNLPCPGAETLITGMEAGQFIRVNVAIGNEYTFETCGLSDSGFDTEMTIYRDDNGLLIDHNDDDCGTDSRITFTPNFTGVVRILIDASGCVSGGPEETSILGTCSTPPCDITSVTFNGQSSCNDNGTPSHPADDFFTANVVVNFVNPPATGNLQIEPGGDAIGTYSIPVNSLVGNSHTFTNVQIKADGTPTVIEVEFTIPSNLCVQTVVGPTVASCSNAICDITSVTFNGQSTCNDNGTPSNPADDIFTANVVVNFVNPPATGNLQIEPGGDAIGTYSISVNSLVGNSHTFTNVQLKADGTPTVIEVEFTIPSNTCVQTTVGPTVNPCSNGGGPICEVIGFTFADITACNDNGTPSDPSDDRFTTDVTIIYSNPFSNSVVALVGGPPLLGVPGNGAPAGIGSNLTHVFNNVLFSANGQPVTFNGVVEHPQGTPCSSLPGTGQAVDPCPCPLVTFGTGGANQTLECDGSNPSSALNAWLAAGGFANVNPSSGTIVSITHGTPVETLICGRSRSFTATFTFTNDCGNSANITGQLLIEDTTPPSLTCPAPLTVSCFEQIPPANPATVTNVSDACNSAFTVTHLSDASGPDGICDNDFTITRTYRATDDCDNSATCTQLITIRDLTPPTITCAAQTTPIECPAAPVFTPPTASDNCTGNVAITFSDVTVPGLCPGTFTTTRTWTATDPCGNTATCARSITVQDVTPPPVPANTASTVACPALATAPVPPVVIDACAGAITPTGPVVTNVPNPLTCEGTMTFTFTFRDCSGNTSLWSHVTTIEREPFTIPVPNGTATVDCPDDTDFAPTPPIVTSNCGEVLTPGLFSLGAKPGCEGNRQYIFRYTDCEGNFADWLFTYLVEYQEFAVPPSELESVECPILATQPVPPVVFDNCGKLLTPIGPTITSTDNAQGCEASRQYAWTYKDCEGNTHVWSKTYRFLYSADFEVFNDETNVVTCLSYAVEPFPPTFYDACGNEISVALTGFSEDIAPGGCSGWRRYDFTYTNCSGQTRPWSFTYEINDNEAPLGICPSGNGGTAPQNGPVAVNVTNLSCMDEVPCPEDYDFSEKIEELLMAGDYFDVCSGNDLVVELQSASDLWECSDTDGDGQFTFGRTFYFRITDPCGNEYPGGCEVTYSGRCLPIETFRQEDWGIAGELPGSAVSPATTDLAIIADLLDTTNGTSNPLIIGGIHRSLTITDPDCIVSLLPGTVWPAALANCHQTNCTSSTGVNCNPMGIGGMKNSLAANAIALTLNLRFNNEYRGLAMNELRNQSLGCLDLSGNILYCPTELTCQLRLFDGNGAAHSFPYTLGGLLDFANLYLDGNLGLSIGQQSVYSIAISQALQRVNAEWSSLQAATAYGAHAAAPANDLGKTTFDDVGETLRGVAMSLSPNPASRYVTLEIANLEEESSVQLEVFNTLGNRLISNNLSKVVSLRHRIELGCLKTGMYLVMVKIEGHRPMVQKLFVNNEGGLDWK
jgi:hypothetical protein